MKPSISPSLRFIFAASYFHAVLGKSLFHFSPLPWQPVQEDASDWLCTAQPILSTFLVSLLWMIFLAPVRLNLYFCTLHCGTATNRTSFLFIGRSVCFNTMQLGDIVPMTMATAAAAHHFPPSSPPDTDIIPEQPPLTPLLSVSWTGILGKPFCRTYPGSCQPGDRLVVSMHTGSTLNVNTPQWAPNIPAHLVLC